ncbi:MAG: response regulator transcription factor [Candidatus Manganitrophaceae bacterium]|nr:MAG: response regulator transcription factor [Candidatus Manganitrophaceae bacterium]
MKKDKKMERRPLTSREIEVVRYVAEGYKNKDIAEKLGIQIKTVETHRTNINNKLGFNHVSQLIIYAIQKGLIKIEIEKEE